MTQNPAKTARPMALRTFERAALKKKAADAAVESREETPEWARGKRLRIILTCFGQRRKPTFV